MQKLKTSLMLAKSTQRLFIQGFINPFKFANVSINGFSVDYIIRWCTARTRPHAVTFA